MNFQIKIAMDSCNTYFKAKAVSTYLFLRPLQYFVRQVCIRFRELSYTDSVWLLAANRTLASNQLDAATRRRSQVQIQCHCQVQIQGPCHSYRYQLYAATRRRSQVQIQGPCQVKILGPCHSY